jgi:antirestriction protein ArdC
LNAVTIDFEGGNQGWDTNSTWGKKHAPEIAIDKSALGELCAAFLCAEFSLDGDLRHAGYIASWIGLLKADPRAFFTACSKAQAAADYLRGLALRDAKPSVAA